MEGGFGHGCEFHPTNRALPYPSQTLSTTDSTWMSLSHPNGHFPTPHTTEWMMEEAASDPALLSRKEILERQNHQRVQLEGAGNRSRAKADPSWDFTEPPPFPNHTCRLCSSFTHCKRRKKEKQPLEWATVPFSIQLRSLL